MPRKTAREKRDELALLLVLLALTGAMLLVSWLAGAAVSRLAENRGVGLAAGAAVFLLCAAALRAVLNRLAGKTSEEIGG